MYFKKLYFSFSGTKLYDIEECIKQKLYQFSWKTQQKDK